MSPKDADRMSNSADPDQTAPLHRPICLKTKDNYRNSKNRTLDVITLKLLKIRTPAKYTVIILKID